MLRRVEDEEDRDVEELQLFLRSHKKLFKWLFARYANSGTAIAKLSSFDQLKERTETISAAELSKLLKNHDITQNILTHAEVLLVQTCVVAYPHETHQHSAFSSERCLCTIFQRLRTISGAGRLSRRGPSV